MNGRFFVLRASSNPVVQIVSLLLFGLVLIGAVMMGAVILTALFALAAVGAAVLAVRVWWLRRKLGRGGSGIPRRADAGGHLIEAEYTVLREREPGGSRD